MDEITCLHAYRTSLMIALGQNQDWVIACWHDASLTVASNVPYYAVSCQCLACKGTTACQAPACISFHASAGCLQSIGNLAWYALSNINHADQQFNPQGKAPNPICIFGYLIPPKFISFISLPKHVHDMVITNKWHTICNLKFLKTYSMSKVFSSPCSILPATLIFRLEVSHFLIFFCTCIKNSIFRSRLKYQAICQEGKFHINWNRMSDYSCRH